MDTESNVPDKEELAALANETRTEIGDMLKKNQQDAEAVEIKLNEVLHKLNRIMEMIKTLSPEAYERISSELAKANSCEEQNEGEKI